MMTEFDKAWREFIEEVAKALRIPAMLDWLAAFIDRYSWIGRIPSMCFDALVVWSLTCILATLAMIFAVSFGLFS